MSVLNASKRFRNSARETEIITKHPKRIRDVFNICEVAEDGIFLIDKKNGIYDRCYIFTDINYINKDDEEKTLILTNMMKWLNSMTVHFKITMANEFQSVNRFVKDISGRKNKEEYPIITKGVDGWVKEKVAEGEIRDIRKIMYLTITVQANSRQEARTYFLNMDVQLGRLFQSMNSIITPLGGRERLETLRAFFHPDESEYTLLYDFGNKKKDPLLGVLPSSIEQEKNWMILGDRFASVLFARDYTSTLDEGKALHGFSDLPYISMQTLDYAPVTKRDFQDMLDAARMNNERAIAQEEDSKRSRGHYAVGISYRKEKKKMELESYDDQAHDNNESCFLVTLFLVVTADSEEELATRLDSVKHLGRENGIFLETCNHTQLKALNTALPNGCRNISYPRSFLTSSLVALQPFYAQELQDFGGFFYGLNRTTKHLVFGNRKRLASPHGMIVGHTGSGKSFFIKETEIAQSLLGTDDDLIILDPQNETQAVCLEFKGEFLDLTPKSQLHMNPLEIPEVVKKGNLPLIQRFIADQTKWLNSFCASAMNNILLTSEHASLIGRAVRELYEPLFREKRYKDEPTLVQIRELMKKYMDEAASKEDADIARKLYNSLEEYTEGSFDLFSHRSNVDIKKRFVVFGLANVPQSLWEPVMITIMHFLSNRMEYNRKQRRPTRLIIDETQEVCRNPSSAEMLLHAVRTFRKFGGIVTMVLQNLTSVLENPDLRDMFSNCGYKYFLDQGGVDAQSLRAVQELSGAEFESLSDSRPGCGLLVWEKKIILLDSGMDRDNPLYERFSTNFHEKETNLFLDDKESDAKKVTNSRELKDVIKNLAERVSVTPSELAVTLGVEEDKIRQIINELLSDGELEIVLSGGEESYKTKNPKNTK